MLASTHYAFSLLLCSMNVEPSIAVSASFFSLLPDIDHPDSLIGRIFLPLSKFLQKRYGHRTVTHSIFAILALTLLLIPINLISVSFYFCSLLAFSSHIFIDLFNRSGVRLFAPLSSKEYISFRTPELRLLVGSWKEYVLLFLLVLLTVLASKDTFSVHGAVRYLGKHLYKNYDSAVKDFQEAGSYLCIAQLEYYDFLERKIKRESLPVLNMYAEKSYFLRNNDRVVLTKDYINEIIINKTEKKIEEKKFIGNDLKILKDIPRNSYVFGSLKISNFITTMKSSEFLTIEKHSDGSYLTFKCASTYEIFLLSNLSEEINKEIITLKQKLCSFQISQLRLEESNIKNKITYLRSKNVYDNYGVIVDLSSNLKKIQNKITTLEIREKLKEDIEFEDKIKNLESGLSVFYNLSSFTF